MSDASTRIPATLAPAAAAPAVEGPRAAVVVASAVASTLVYVLNSRFAWGWPAATAFAVAMDALFLAHIVRRRDGLVARLALAGLAAGLVIPVSDAFCIRYGGLRYPEGGPFLYLSPLYIPLSFVGATVQLGYVSHLLERRRGPLAAALVTAALGTLYVPLYEYLARAGRLWAYEGDALLLGAVPRYIVFGELLLCLAVSVLTRLLAARRWPWAVPLGLAFGAFITGSMVLGHALFP
jgi:hypothetical protein